MSKRTHQQAQTARTDSKGFTPLAYRQRPTNTMPSSRRTARHKLQDLLAGAVLATVLTIMVGSVAYNLATQQDNQQQTNQQQDTTQASHTTPSHDASEPYARLTPTLCVTDYECETADILHRYHTGQLVDNPFAPLADNNATADNNDASDYIPVIEPLDCTGLKGRELAECNTHNTHAGEPVHTTH